MDDNLAILLLMIAAIAAAVTLLLITRSRSRVAEAGLPTPTDTLIAENATLKGHVGRVEQRLAVLERIATDPAERTAREIAMLREGD